MDSNTTDLNANETIDQLTDFFNISVANFTNESEVAQVKLFDLYEAYKTKEREQLVMYKWVAYILGSLIILSNLTVVISSGLILRKGQQPKSTYLLLGNVSLADTIIGISIIFGASVDNSMGSNQLCIFQLGMLVCPAMVSIFSVGLIAVDRYIYILHGLYYQRWFNATRVRIGIVCIWIIGITLGFLPAMGWTNNDPLPLRCAYVAVYPGELVAFNSILSTIPIVIVTILYSIILLQALKNLKKIKASENGNVDLEAEIKPKLRINRGHTKIGNNKSLSKHDNGKIKRSASFNTCCRNFNSQQGKQSRSKSTDDLSIKANESQTCVDKLQIQKGGDRQSNFSVCTVETNCPIGNSLRESTVSSIGSLAYNPCKRTCKVKGPNKWRAVTVVMLTSGSFIVTWTPFFVVVIFFVFCEEKRTNSQCLHLLTLLTGPLATLALCNSVLNPLIYAWWHKGFKKTVKSHFRKHVQMYLLSKSIKNNISSSM